LLLVMLLALLVGVSLGLLGGGGSILTVPILRYVLGIEAHQAIALSLLVVGTTSVFALVPHARASRVHFRIGLVFGAAGMVGAFLAGQVARFIPASVLLIGFAVMMFVTAVAMLRSRCTPLESAPEVESEARATRLPIAKVLIEGLLVGSVTGLVGAGGGFLVVPALYLLGGLPMPIAVGTSLVVIAMKSLAGFAGFLAHTPIDWTLAAALSTAAVLGSFLGSLLVSRISSEALRLAFGWLVVAMALFMLAQELPALVGFALPAWVAPLVGLLGAGASYAISRARGAGESSDVMRALSQSQAPRAS
jgi:uncharacterized membrane protein YfcA